ncbi:hypothetical protein CCE29_11690 [Lacticaseibacillus rhamnosus]|uniref:hypothetical protein n=1 Tax=Lacticaseibacillus rhamnosus TaxID=47715 RepID=UPI0001B5E8EF|nr:hypothetical protein [Lacticaseibacillus rhamnosus]AXI94945.1 hypothetical protein DU507_10825 [Lacticaseibacillus rhamnosus GG]AQY35204.1 hypothetical protein B4583_08235 [Lacticaseibacillus rhamnosus]ART96559.1 hypothetical protein CCE29_11690 [Lacticaseibacillus rhamnosus]AZZ23616.1 hypothetical protein CYG41_10785 [Lacticaseibacillus rhamnosus]PTV08888.1 hypothetical protein DB338_04645 [Lacticaseibacillus rhamnosus]
MVYIVAIQTGYAPKTGLPICQQKCEENGTVSMAEKEAPIKITFNILKPFSVSNPLSQVYS